MPTMTPEAMASLYEQIVPLAYTPVLSKADWKLICDVITEKHGKELEEISQ